jgi:hypothetical protein
MAGWRFKQCSAVRHSTAVSWRGPPEFNRESAARRESMRSRPCIRGTCMPVVTHTGNLGGGLTTAGWGAAAHALNSQRPNRGWRVPRVCKYLIRGTSARPRGSLAAMVASAVTRQGREERFSCAVTEGLFPRPLAKRGDPTHKTDHQLSRSHRVARRLSQTASLFVSSSGRWRATRRRQCQPDFYFRRAFLGACACQKLKLEHTEGVARPRSATMFGTMREGGEDGARQRRRRRDQDMPVGSSRSASPHIRSAKATAPRPVGRECPWPGCAG